jgi:flagellar motility protein MotE (MotC chaperone)
MADEETTELSNEGTGAEQPKKKLVPIIAALGLLFVLSGAGNFIHLKMTYVPPLADEHDEHLVQAEEQVSHARPVRSIDLSDEVLEEKKQVEPPGPVLTIDLSDEADDSLMAARARARAIADSLAIIRADSIAHEDSIRTLIADLRSSVQRGDSLLNLSQRELTRVQRALETKMVAVDSVNYKQATKLAKIVENMPAEEAAKMMEALSDAMVINILMQLKQRQAAKIMAAFSASRSARLSEAILKPVVQG